MAAFLTTLISAVVSSVGIALLKNIILDPRIFFVQNCYDEAVDILLLTGIEKSKGRLSGTNNRRGRQHFRTNIKQRVKIVCFASQRHLFRLPNVANRSRSIAFAVSSTFTINQE
jgi:hypothetical protein